MSELTIETLDAKTCFIPGQALDGSIVWQLDNPAHALELRLFWHTHGRGRPDLQIVEVLRFDDPAPQGRRDFHFMLPFDPYSFVGQLITIQWALELVALPSKECNRLDIVVSPSGRPVLAHPMPE